MKSYEKVTLARAGPACTVSVCNRIGTADQAPLRTGPGKMAGGKSKAAPAPSLSFDVSRRAGIATPLPRCTVSGLRSTCGGADAGGASLLPVACFGQGLRLHARDFCLAWTNALAAGRPDADQLVAGRQ